MAPAVTRLTRAFQAARLLQAADPVSATFTAPFCVRPDPDEDEIIRSSVPPCLHGALVMKATTRTRPWQVGQDRTSML
jgi:hypothetical protein